MPVFQAWIRIMILPIKVNWMSIRYRIAAPRPKETTKLTVQTRARLIMFPLANLQIIAMVVRNNQQASNL